MPPHPDGLPATLIDHPTLVAGGSMRRVVDLDPDSVQAPDGTALPVAAGALPADASLGPAPDDPASQQPPRPAPSTGSDLDITGVLGTGGLNIVHRAHHRPLQREVAIKRVRPDRDRPMLRDVLVREARVTGALEHPGVVPIHDLRWSEEGEPLVVLKRISGDSWSRLVHDRALWAQRFPDERDWLAWNLRVLVRVCEVVHFAHSRGYLHRDLKPDNVMVGEQGEILVVDWGLAVALDDRADPELPRADRVRTAAGTPAYMAPEQLGEGAPLTPRTDVFQLGAVLFELLAGRPPFWGHVDKALVDRIRRADAPLPTHDQPWLAAIQARAMQADPADRYDSAEALRRVLQHVLEHRDADALARTAAAQLAELQQAVAQPEPDRHRAYLHYGQVRLGFRQALAAWPHHEGAAAGLEAASRAIAELELRRGDPDAAALALAELDPAPPELSNRLTALRLRVAAEQAEAEGLRAVGQDYDLRRGARTRTFILVCLGLLFTLIPWTPVVLRGRVDWAEGYPGFIATSIVFLALIAGLSVWARESVMATAVNRGVAGGLALAMLGQLALDLGAWKLGVAPMTAHTFHILLWAGAAAIVGLLVARAILVPAGVFFLAYVLAVLRPEWTWPMISLSALCFTGVAVWAGWRVLGWNELLRFGGPR